jgi:CHASE3 domain sensor protein
MPRAARLRKLIVASTAASAALLFALCAFSAYEIVRHEDDLAWAKHSDVVVDLLQETRFQIVLAELSRQSFRSTGKTEARDEVRRAAETLRANAEALQRLTADSPERTARAEELATLATAIRYSVEAPSRHGQPAEGAPAFKRAVGLARAMESEERGLQDERDRRERRSAATALISLGSAAALALVFSAAALWNILRRLREQELPPA